MVAGVLNTLAGGGSFLTVPLLITVGVPATVANGTNRIGVVVQSAAAVVGFGRGGVHELAVARRFLLATLAGSLLGAALASKLPDVWFQRAFAILMLLFLPVLLLDPRPQAGSRRAFPGWLQQLGFVLMGLYGGAFQAGLGIPLLLILVSLAGLDLVRGNAAKVAINAAQQALALAVFAASGKVWWLHGALLAVGSGLGGYLGSRLGTRIGERGIRPIVAAAVVALALRLLGVW